MLAGLFVLEIVVALAVRAAIRWAHWQRSYRARSACDVSFCLPCWFAPHDWTFITSAACPWRAGGIFPHIWKCLMLFMKIMRFTYLFFCVTLRPSQRAFGTYLCVYRKEDDHTAPDRKSSGWMILSAMWLRRTMFPSRRVGRGRHFVISQCYQIESNKNKRHASHRNTQIQMGISCSIQCCQNSK